jgi:hypothetical protein
MEKVFHEKVPKKKYYQNIFSIWNKYTLTEPLINELLASLNILLKK